MGKDWPPVLRLFHEELGYTVRAGKPSLGYQLFYIDLSSWKLRLSKPHTSYLGRDQRPGRSLLPAYDSKSGRRAARA